MPSVILMSSWFSTMSLLVQLSNGYLYHLQYVLQSHQSAACESQFEFTYQCGFALCLPWNVWRKKVIIWFHLSIFLGTSWKRTAYSHHCANPAPTWKSEFWEFYSWKLYSVSIISWKLGRTVFCVIWAQIQLPVHIQLPVKHPEN